MDQIQQKIEDFNKQQTTFQNTMKDVLDVHEVKKAMFEDYFVPGHEPRTASSLYTKTHDNMINNLDMPCFICGVSKSKINDTTVNTCGATQLETHHFILEWSLANAANWDVLKQMHSDFPDWDKIVPGDESTYFNFVDHPYNMLILCDIHHRGKFHGIHAIEYPVWVAQKFMQSTFKFINDSASKDLSDLFVDDMS